MTTNPLTDEQIMLAERWKAREAAKKADMGRSGNATMRYRVALLFAELGRSVAADIKPKSRPREPFALDLEKGPQVFDADGPVTLSEAAIKRLFPDRGADAHSG